MDATNDRVVSVLPIHLSNHLAPDVHLHQFPLLSRPLEVPPSSALSGKRIRARIKPEVKRLEIHLPVDTRPEVWNSDRSKELGSGRVEDDKEKNQDTGRVKLKEGEEPRLTEIRLQSEQIPHTGVYVLGIVRDGEWSSYDVIERLKIISIQDIFTCIQSVKLTSFAPL